MRRRTRLGAATPAALLAGALLSALLVACGSSSGAPPGASTTSGSASPRPSSTATLSIVSPTNGQVLRGGTVVVKVDLQGATIVPATSTNLRPDQGHLHVILDDTLVTMSTGLKTVIPNVPPGQHLLKVEFVANDHAPFDPRVIAAVSFEEKG